MTTTCSMITSTSAFNYMMSLDSSTPLFSLKQMKEASLFKPLEYNNKSILGLIGCNYNFVISVDEKIIDNLSEVIREIFPIESIWEKEASIIAKIANFLTYGTEFEVVDKTAEYLEKKIQFQVKKNDEEYFKVELNPTTLTMEYHVKTDFENTINKKEEGYHQ